MRKVCSWCRLVMTVGSSPYTDTTHSICPGCKTSMYRQLDAVARARASAIYPCPHCPCEGRPYNVNGAGGRTVTVRCDGCGLAWTSDSPPIASSSDDPAGIRDL